MRFVAEPFSQYRLQRFHRWAMLWLTWLAAFLEAADAFAPLSEQARNIAHRWLDDVERVVVAVVLLRAAPHVRRLNPRKGVSAHRRNDTALRRAIIGSKLRQSLHAKDFRRRIEALTQNMGALVNRVLRRLPCGLTRRRPITAAPEALAPALPSAAQPAVLSADTSSPAIRTSAWS